LVVQSCDPSVSHQGRVFGPGEFWVILTKESDQSIERAIACCQRPSPIPADK
jgi:hypothetical protein